MRRSFRKHGRHAIWHLSLAPLVVFAFYAGIRAPRAGWFWLVFGGFSALSLVALIVGWRMAEEEDPTLFERAGRDDAPIEKRGVRERGAQALLWVSLVVVWCASWWY